MVEVVDTQDLKILRRNSVPVQVRVFGIRNSFNSLLCPHLLIWNPAMNRMNEPIRNIRDGFKLRFVMLKITFVELNLKLSH